MNFPVLQHWGFLLAIDLLAEMQEELTALNSSDMLQPSKVVSSHGHVYDLQLYGFRT